MSILSYFVERLTAIMLLPSVFLLILLHRSQSARILCAFISPALSHAAVFQPIYKELSLRGHQVTVLTARPLHNKTLTNLTEIEISTIHDAVKKNTQRSAKISKDKPLFLILVFMGEYLLKFTEKILTEVNNFFPSGGTEFDLVIVEDLSPLIYSLGCRFKVPMISVSSNILLCYTHDLLGNPEHPVLYPDLSQRTEYKEEFYEKVINVINNVVIKLYYNWLFLPRIDKITKGFFGEDCPRIDIIMKNVSLVLTNTQPFLQPARPHIPIMIEMGGLLQIQQEKPLPEDLQTYLDRSHQGVIYFSLGSISKSSELSETLRDTITEALSELPYNVLWKFEVNSLPNQPSNVMIRKWMPQQDVLRHKNIKAFVTHAGLLSVEEAIFFSVPMVAVPLVLDQPSNARRVVELEIGQSVEYLTLTKDILKDAIMEVAGNEKYKHAIQEVSYLLQDTQMKSLDKAVWWIEYVIRHQGADHLKSRSTFSPWYEYFLLDVISIFLFLGVVISCLIYFFIKCIKVFIGILP